MKNKDILICLLLGICSLLIRLCLISKGPFSHESLDLALKAQQTLDTGQLQFRYGAGGYPLTILITVGFLFLTRLFTVNDPIVAANLMSVVCSSLAIPLLYLLVKKLLDRPTAFMSAVMLSACPIYLGISVYGKGHAIEFMFLFVGFLMLLKYFDTDRISALIFAGVAIGLFGAVRLQDLLFIIPALYFFLIFIRPADKSIAVSTMIRHKTAQCAIFSVTIAVVVVLMHLYYLIGPVRDLYISEFYRAKAATFTADHKQSLFLSFPYYKEWFTINFSIIGMVAFLIGAIVLLISRFRVGLFCALWFLAPFIFYLFIDTTIPRLFVILLPPMIIYICYLFSLYFRSEAMFKRAISVILYLVVVYISFMEIYPVLKYRHDHALLPEYVYWVKKRTPVNTQMVVQDDFLFFQHYGNFPVIVKPLPGGEGQQLRFDTFKHKLDRLFEQHIPVYTTGVGLYSYDPQKKLATFLRQHYTVQEVDTHLYQDYHSGELTNVVFKNPLIRISPKKDAFP